jgi:hypothetical protein
MTYLETPPYTGHITLIQVDKVRDPLWKSFAGTPVCLVDAGYAWLQQFPANAHHALTPFHSFCNLRNYSAAGSKTLKVYQFRLQDNIISAKPA